MPTARKTGHRIRAGLYAAAALTSTYEVRQMAIQSDQPLTAPWGINSRESKPPAPARITSNADKSKSIDGFLNCSLKMSYMTFGMWGYWLDSFLPGNAESSDVTVMVYDEEDVEVYLQGLIYRPRPGNGMVAVQGGWAEVEWVIERGVVIA